MSPLGDWWWSRFQRGAAQHGVTLSTGPSPPVSGGTSRLDGRVTGRRAGLMEAQRAPPDQGGSRQGTAALQAPTWDPWLLLSAHRVIPVDRSCKAPGKGTGRLWATGAFPSC